MTWGMLSGQTIFMKMNYYCQYHTNMVSSYCSMTHLYGREPLVIYNTRSRRSSHQTLSTWAFIPQLHVIAEGGPDYNKLVLILCGTTLYSNQKRYFR